MEKTPLSALEGKRLLKGKARSNLYFVDDSEVEITLSENALGGSLKIGSFQAGLTFVTITGSELDEDILIYEYPSKYSEKNYLHLRIDGQDKSWVAGQTVQGGLTPGGSLHGR